MVLDFFRKNSFLLDFLREAIYAMPRIGAFDYKNPRCFLRSMTGSQLRYFHLLGCVSLIPNLQRGYSSVGRAPAWHAGGQRFDPA